MDLDLSCPASEGAGKIQAEKPRCPLFDSKGPEQCIPGQDMCRILGDFVQEYPGVLVSRSV